MWNYTGTFRCIDHTSNLDGQFFSLERWDARNVLSNLTIWHGPSLRPDAPGDTADYKPLVPGKKYRVRFELEEFEELEES